METNEHPSAARLEEYALGRLPLDDVDNVSRHVEACADCQDTISGLNLADDTLVWAMGAGSAGNPPDNPPDDAADVDQQAIDRIAGRAHAAADQGDASTAIAFGPYALRGKIGEGGMGSVYRAEHTKLSKPVAVKLLPEEWGRSAAAVARFEREMQSVGRLEHENVVRAYDAGEHDGRHFISMELLDGLDLGALVRCEGVLPVAAACECIRQAALGIHHAHDQGLLHRDIKPSNLMLTTGGTVKVLDLGLASIAGVGADDTPSDDLPAGDQSPAIDPAPG